MVLRRTVSYIGTRLSKFSRAWHRLQSPWHAYHGPAQRCIAEGDCFARGSRRRVLTSPVIDSMSSSSKDNDGPPVVVVLGSTASGKSKLAIDLAKHVGGEVISADSMQIYEGLDILTNKASEEEMQGIPHHMISVIDRSEKFDVVQFRDMTLPLVEDILAKGKIPLIVGGTNYYIESLLWKVLIEENEVQSQAVEGDHPDLVKRPRRSSPDATSPALVYMKELRGYFTEADVTNKWTIIELHEALQEVDPIRALKLHPNDKRKVVRSLQVFFRTGKRHSDLIEAQFPSDDECEAGPATENMSSTLTTKVGGPLRFPNTICFWIQADRDRLNSRINSRVDAMQDRGLRNELDGYIDSLKSENRDWNFEEGQLQSIGVKEFASYINLAASDRKTDLGEKSFKEGLDRLKVVTRQYAKRQLHWVRQRFLKPSRRQVPAVYGLNGNETDETSWKENVTNPAVEILGALMSNQLDKPVIAEHLCKVISDTSESEDLLSRNCEVCNRIMLGSVQWAEHMKSAKHWKMVKRKKRLADEACGQHAAVSASQ